MGILITGAAGYIGTHTAVALLESGYDIIAADNYINSCPEAFERVEKIAGKPVKKYRAELQNPEEVRRIFRENEIEAVVHLAGLKSIIESLEHPALYYRNNIGITLALLDAMAEYGCKRMVFSSSATVYGIEAPVPYLETCGIGTCTNPYGRTKAVLEQLLTDVSEADRDMSVVMLRYFNPVAAHKSGLIGDDNRNASTNIMSHISRTAAGIEKCLTIFGNDYPTEDGTCIRDFVHIADLAEAHVKALEYGKGAKGTEAINIGTGKPCSVLRMIKTFEEVNGVKIRYEFGGRRQGDLSEAWANADKAATVLGWTAKRGIEEMCRDAWRWQIKNPEGYR